MARRVARGLPLLLLVACTVPAYPAPASRPLPATTAPGPVAADEGDVGRIRALEQTCRARLSRSTVGASLTALDRVHEVLGAGCDIRTVDHDPLHWHLSCRSDALFDSGKYALSARPAACRELGGPAAPWSCAGAVLSSLLRPQSAQSGAIVRMEVAVLGHVDRQPLRAESTSHLCTGLQETLAYKPPVAWSAVAEDAEEGERLYANNQLAWCRAASVSDALLSGMRRAAKRHRRAAPTSALELAIAGFGDAWLGSQKEGRCPSTGASSADEPRCADARRVDLLLRFVPHAGATESECDRQGETAEDALACLEACLEEAAVGQQVGSGVQAGAAPIFRSGEQNREALPAGFYLHRVPDREGRALDLRRVCRAVGIDGARCGS